MNKLVSVVILCRNEVKYIKKTVEEVLKSEHSPLEVIIVDGMSNDGTREVLKELSNKYTNVRFVDNPEKLTPFAYNYGVKNSAGEYIQIIGARNVLETGYISNLVKTLESDARIACAGGDYQHVYDTNVGKYISYAMESKFGVGAGNYRTMQESCFVDTVGVPMYPKRIFDELGYFDERLTRNQDDDYNYRVTKADYKIFYNHNAKCTYMVRGSFKKLFTQMSQYGYFKVFVNRKHKTLTTIRQIVPALFLLFLVLGFILGLLVHAFWTLYLAVIGLYMGLGIYSSMKANNNLTGTLLTFFACFIMHVGYGYGYLKGIRDFLILGKVSPEGKMERQTT